jgi:RNA polymerase sigma-70 factor (ECF subfamily)
MLRRLKRHAGPSTAASPASPAEVPWLQPYPDTILDAAERPDEVAIGRETIELAFLVALQVLPPRQRAAMVARDVLGWPASETASMLGTSVAAANSAVQRARETMQHHLPARRADWSEPESSPAERELLARFIEAHERCDLEAAVAIAAEDIRLTMPPQPMCFVGVSAMPPLFAQAAAMGTWRLFPVRTNRMPAAASFLLRPGDSIFRAFKLDVLRIGDGNIAEITTFDASMFRAFGLPPEWDGQPESAPSMR